MMGKPRVLVIDPDDQTRPLILEALAATGRVGEIQVETSYARRSAVCETLVPELVIINLEEDYVAALALMTQLATIYPQAAILPAGSRRDSSLLLAVMKVGAREFLVLPPVPSSLAVILDRLIVPVASVKEQAPRGPRLIAVTGAIGGVGTTTLAVNLAVSLAKSPDCSVLLTDFDLLFGPVEVMLDMLPDFTLLEATQKIDRVDEALLRRAIARHSSGLYVLPRPHELEDAAKVDNEPLRRLLEVARSTFSTVVVDTGKSLHSSDFIAYEMADVILVVIQLDLIGLHNAVRLIKLLRKFDGLSEKIKIVVNRVGSFETEISLKKAETILGAPIAWQLPNGKGLVHEARSKGIPIAVEGTGSKIHQAILEIAHALRPFPGVLSDVKRRRGLFAALF
jgi:pilus assembly protein CpaE